MARRLNLAADRRKLALRGRLLQNRARIAELQTANKQLRVELQDFRRKGSSGATVTGLKLRSS